MSKALVVLVLLGILLFAGCASQGGAPSQSTQGQTGTQPETQKPAELQKSVCGNGIKEAGETPDNCCKDAGCPATFKCDSKFENGSTVSFCLKVNKADTFEAGKIKKLTADITTEINKDINLIDIAKARSKLNEITQYETQLKQQGYDTKTEEFMQKAMKARIDVKELQIQRSEEFAEAGTDAQKIDIAKKQMEDVKNLISTLEKLKSDYSSNLQEAEEVYDYDISQNIDSWKDTYKASEMLLKEYEKQTAPVSLSLAIVTATDTARYIHNPVITVSNEGDNDVTNLVIEAELTKGGTVIESDSDALFMAGGSSIKSVPAGKTVKGYLNIMWYGGSVTDGTYTLKVTARRGADATPLSSDSATVTVSGS